MAKTLRLGRLTPSRRCCIRLGLRATSALCGAVLAQRTPGVYMLEGRDDLAALWDIRVHPDARRDGIGHMLFEAATREARQHTVDG